MGGETDLGLMLRTLDVRRRAGEFLYVQLPHGQALPDAGVEAVISEVEGVTIVMRADAAVAAGLDGAFRCAWLTLTVNSSLDAVGLTAAISTALAVKAVPCNVLAGHDHDHILVPIERVDDAVAALHALRASAEGHAAPADGP